MHPTSTTYNVNILYALKINKCCRRYKYGLLEIKVDNIVVHNIKYLPSTFDGNVFFILSPLDPTVHDAYGKWTIGMDKIYDGHAWC